MSRAGYEWDQAGIAIKKALAANDPVDAFFFACRARAHYERLISDAPWRAKTIERSLRSLNAAIEGLRRQIVGDA